MRKIRIVTKKHFLKEIDTSEKLRKSLLASKNPFIMEVQEFDKTEPLGWYWFSCGFTPWRLFATFFVKQSKYYQARVNPQYHCLDWYK